MDAIEACLAINVFARFYQNFTLLGGNFTAADRPGDKYEAISFRVDCATQKEIDYYWEKLSADPKAEQCGWCKDPYGVSWQIHPAMLDETMKNGTREQIDRLTNAFLPMKKFDIAVLIKAFDQQ